MNDAPLTREEREAALNAIVDRVHRFRLETPAIFFLEMNRPLAGIAGLASHAFTPLLGAFAGFERTERYASLLGDREILDELLERLDASRTERRQAPSDPPSLETRNS